MGEPQQSRWCVSFRTVFSIPHNLWEWLWIVWLYLKAIPLPFRVEEAEIQATYSRVAKRKRIRRKGA